MSKQENLTDMINARLRRVSREVHLQRSRSFEGKTVWVAACSFGRYPHKYTTSTGLACWDYWTTLEEAAEELGVEVD